MITAALALCAIQEPAGVEETQFDARHYVTSLTTAIVTQHPDFEGTTEAEFGARCLARLRERFAAEPTLLRVHRHARKDFVDPGSFTGDWDAFCQAWLPEGAGDADVEIDRRLSLLAEAELDALGDPFTHLLRGDHLYNLGSILDQLMPSAMGLSARPDGERYRLDAVVRDSDAWRKGVRPGDELVAIGGLSVHGRPRRTIDNWLARPGPITIQRAGFISPLELVIDALQPTAGLSASLLDGDVGYLSFQLFSVGLFAPLMNQAVKLQRRGAKAFVLDLRCNPGGAISEGQAIAGLFVPEKSVVAKIRQRESVHVLPAELRTGHPRFGPDVPVVVLIDGGSASCSELLASALRDLAGSRLVGATTFGKGVGQSVVPLILMGAGAPTGRPRTDALWLTNLRFVSPLDHDHHRIGIVPDVAIVDPPLTRERMVARARLLDRPEFIEALTELDVTTEEIAALRAGATVPAAVLALAQQHDLAPADDEASAALADITRFALANRHPELAACPPLDPPLAAALAEAHARLAAPPSGQ